MRTSRRLSGTPHPSYEKLQKIKALEERGVDGEQDAAKKILARHGISITDDLPPKTVASVLAMEEHNKRYRERQEEEYKNWEKRFRRLRYDVHTQQGLFAILHHFIQDHGLRLYTAPSQPATFYCQGSNVCFDDIRDMYRGNHYQNRLKQHGNTFDCKRHWDSRSSAFSLPKVMDYTDPAACPYPLQMLDAKDLRAIGIRLDPDFEYIPGEEPHVRGHSFWTSIQIDSRYRNQLLKALRSLPQVGEVYSMTVASPFYQPDTYYANCYYSDIKRAVIQTLQTGMGPKAQTNEQAFMHQTGLRIQPVSYSHPSHRHWNDLSYPELRHLRLVADSFS